MELVNDFSVSVPIAEAWKTLTDLERIAPCMPGAQLQEIEGDQYRGVVKIKVGPILAQFKGQASFVERDEAAHRAVLRAEGRDTGGKGNANAVITAQLTPEGEGTKVSVSTDLTITGKVAQFGRGALADVSEKILKQFVQQLEATVLHPGGASENGGPAAGTSTGSRGTGGTGGAGGTGTVSAEPTAATGAAAESASGAATAADTASADATQPPVEEETLSSPAVAGGPAASTPSATANSGPATPSPTAVAPGEGTTARRVINQQEAEPIDLLQTAGVPIFKRLIPPLVILAVVIVVVRWRRRS